VDVIHSKYYIFYRLLSRNVFLTIFFSFFIQILDVEIKNKSVVSSPYQPHVTEQKYLFF